MTEVTYVSEIECEIVVPNGMLETQVIRIRDSDDHLHVLRVSKGGLIETGGKQYLPIGLVNVDREQRRALIELPQEADSGTSRVWIPFRRFRQQETTR